MTDAPGLIALLALAILCLAVRWAGFLAASSARISPRLQRFIAAVPAPLLAALVASSAAEDGAGAMVAIAAAVLLMIVVRNEIIAAVGGVGLALLLF